MKTRHVLAVVTLVFLSAVSTQAQICITLYDPVCGIDGRTYGNACEAALAGVSVAYYGPCFVENKCTSNDDCPNGYYCKFNDCSDHYGVVTIRPNVCTEIWAPVCGCDGYTYPNQCEAAAAGVSIAYQGECFPPGPTVVMTEPRVMPDDVHTGNSGVKQIKILWSEPVIFTPDDITIVDQQGNPVTFTTAGSDTEIMTLLFDSVLIYDSYTITVTDNVVAAGEGFPVDGDNDGQFGGNAVIIMEHRNRPDFDGNNTITMEDLAAFARQWLWQK